MDSWNCVRCGDGLWGERPDDGLCCGCVQELESEDTS